MSESTRESLGPIVVINTALAQIAETRAAVDAFTQHMADQNPERLEQERAAAWGYDRERLSPDAMTVTFDQRTSAMSACCDHPRVEHTNDSTGNGMCIVCPDDTAQTWRHGYQAADRTTEK